MMSNYNRPIIGFRAKKMSNIENPAKLVSVTVKDRQLMSLIIIIKNSAKTDSKKHRCREKR